jgi:hypothetical protein
MRWCGSRPDWYPYKIYNWQAQVDWRPGVCTFQGGSTDRVPGIAETVVGSNGEWVADNPDGLLTTAVQFYGGGGPQNAPPGGGRGSSGGGRGGDGDATGSPILGERLTADLHVLKVRLEPITTETAPGGTAIVNPAVVASNGLARYSIDVKPDTIPDSVIEWSVAGGAGRLEFYNGNNKGRSVVVRGKEAGDFKLEVSIHDGTFLPKPYIYGTVKERTVIPLHIFMLYDANNNPAVPMSRVEEWVAEANRIYRQAAMSFFIASVTEIRGKPDWFNVPFYSDFVKMCSYTNNTGGLEVYCVDTLPIAMGLHSRGQWLGDPKGGLAVAAHATLQVLAHEIGHACGLRDIPLDRLGNTLISEHLGGEKNWSGGTGTGYYFSGLKHADLIKRLLMFELANGIQADIPLGDVWAYPALQAQGLSPLSVGVNSMNRNPRH